MKFGDKLQNLRKASSLSQEQLADKLNVSRQAVSKWESNASYPEMDKLIAMCKLFKCSMDDLVNDNVKDKEIITKKENSINDYVIDFMNFFVESFNMIFSMKITSLMRMIVELLIIGFILYCGTSFVLYILAYILDIFIVSRLGYNSIIEAIIILIVMFLVLFVIIIYIQIYKTRYLNYYLKEKYKSKQINDLNIEDIEPDKKKIELKEEKIEFNNNKTKFVIRDKERSSFMETLIRLITILSKAFVIVFIAPWIVLAFIFFILALVISLYLIFSNFIFFGITLIFIGILAVLELALEFIYKFLINKKVNVKRYGITFLLSFIIIGIGSGISIIALKDFKIIDNSNNTNYSKSINYSDDLNFITSSETTINFTIDDNINDVKLDVEYNKNQYEISSSITENDKYRFIKIDYENKRTDNFIEYLNTFINNLKNDIFIVEDDYYYDYIITITSNKENVKNIIKNISKENRVSVYETKKGYMVSVVDFVHEGDICTLNNKGYYECIVVSSDNFCEYEVDKYNRVIPKDEDNCTCGKYYDDYYYCHTKYDDDME